VSRGKWSDAIIDSGREWIIPDAISRGELLYRDVVYWVGPFTPYLHALFLKVFGSTFSTLALAGTLDSLGFLAAMYYATRRVAGGRVAVVATVLAVPVIVFMPNSGGVLIGMGYRHAATFSLLAIVVASGLGRVSRNASLAAAGALAGLSGLCRTEWGAATLLSLLVAAGLRARRRSEIPREALILSGAATGVFGTGVSLFVALAGWRAVIEEGHLLLTGLPEETRTFLWNFSGVGDWLRGLAQLLYSSAIWLGAFLALRWLALKRERAVSGGDALLQLAIVLLGAALGALLGGGSGAVLFSAAPAVCLTAFLVGTLRREHAHGFPLMAFGLMGLLVSHRRFFHIGDSWYVGNPLAFALVCGAGLLHFSITAQTSRSRRTRLSIFVASGIALLVCLAFLGRFLQYRSDERVPIPGTGGMLSARPALARDITELAETIRHTTRPDEGLVVFPEGELLNFLSERRNPSRYKMYLPGYLGTANEKEVLRDLERSAPRVAVLWPRQTPEYGPMTFGVGYGTLTAGWVRHEFVCVRDSGRWDRRIRLCFRVRSSSAASDASRAHPIDLGRISP